MKVGVLYADFGLQQRFQSVLEVGPLENGKFMVNRVSLYRCNEQWIRDSEPFVHTGEAD
jgi:hypothetical protein